LILGCRRLTKTAFTRRGFEQLDNQGLADSAPHVYRVNVYYLDPTTLVHTETVGHDFTDDSRRPGGRGWI